MWESLNVVFTYDNLDRMTGKKYNGDTQQRVEYEYGPDGNLAFVMDHAVGTRTQFIYDMAGRVATEKEFATTARGDRTVKSSVRYAYENKTNRLTGVSHLFAGNTQDIGYRYGNLGSGEMPDQIYDVTWNGAKKQSYSYDGLGRLTNKQLFTTSGQTVNNFYTYIDVAGTNKTTTLVQKMDTAAGTYSYTYDVLGNISTVSDGTHTTRYQYDALGQMEYVRDEKADTETYYGYTNGNITYRSVYSLTSGKLIEWDNWTYGNDQWKDLLTTYNSKTFRDDENGNGMTIDHGDQGITYDGIGNPLTIGEKRFYWHNVNQLNIIWEGSNLYEYSYDVDNQRYKKNVNGVETEFFYNGSTLAGQKTGNDMLVFMYDDNGDAFGFKYNGTEYYYVRNAQNDITAVLDANQNIVASYVYDAWGQILSSTGDMAEINPLRYRGYYYDSETGYYYLNSRYYSPELCRFLNADSVLGANQDLLGYNQFAYCSNDPINNCDPSGHGKIKTFFGKISNAVKKAYNNVVSFVNKHLGPQISVDTKRQTLTDEVLGSVGIAKITHKTTSKVSVTAGAKKTTNVYFKTSATSSSVGIKNNFQKLSTNFNGSLSGYSYGAGYDGSSFSLGVERQGFNTIYSFSNSRSAGDCTMTDIYSLQVNRLGVAAVVAVGVVASIVVIPEIILTAGALATAMSSMPAKGSILN